MADEKVLKRIEDRLVQLEANIMAGLMPQIAPEPVPWFERGWRWNPTTPRWPWPPTPIPVDPAPWADNFRRNYSFPWNIDKISDPPPPDFSHLKIEQLETLLHSIIAEKVRLDSMENQLKEQIATRREHG